MCDEVVTVKRNNYISCDEYFMSVAMLSSMRSKDPSTQVGACIVSLDNKIVGTGYNGFPNGCSDDIFPWSRDGGRLKSKYAYVVHAELNAILNSNSSVRGCTIYVALFPCEECAKAIIQSGISNIVYASDKYADTDGVKASKLMLDAAGVEYVGYSGFTINNYHEGVKKDVRIEHLKQVIRAIRSSTQNTLDLETMRRRIVHTIDESQALE